jgi:cell fate regulator YaaT (PSP1 superfamily)
LADRAVRETERGKSIGTVIQGPLESEEQRTGEGLKTILRKAQPDDIQAAAGNVAREKEAYAFCQTRIKERGMDMKLVKVEYLFDGSKAIFYFTADGRIDFRELVKDMAHAFHTRIEMRQIGVRDESGMVGGLGICGRELCASSRDSSRFRSRWPRNKTWHSIPPRFQVNAAGCSAALAMNLKPTAHSENVCRSAEDM